MRLTIPCRLALTDTAHVEYRISANEVGVDPQSESIVCEVGPTALEAAVPQVRAHPVRRR